MALYAPIAEAKKPKEMKAGITLVHFLAQRKHILLDTLDT